MLGTSAASVMSALHRARTALEAELPAPHERAPLPSSPAERELVARFTDAVVGGDFDAVVALLTDYASLTMPPEPIEYRGPTAIARFLSTVPAGGRLDMFRLVATRANGQPAFGCYLRDPQAPIAHAYGPHGPDTEPRPHRRDHRLPGHERVPALRAPTDSARLVRGTAVRPTTIEDWS